MYLVDIRAVGRRSLAGGLAALGLVAMTNGAQAQTVGQPTTSAPALSSGSLFDDSFLDNLTWHGVTLYGTVDIGAVYQSHGMPVNAAFPTGTEYLVSKNSAKAKTQFSENGLSQSKIGLKGDEPLFGDVSGVFKLETTFNPLSMKLSDASRSMTQANGRALTDQNANGDSSRAGQLFAGAAYAGFSSKEFGSLTYGRQNGLLNDNVTTYDPMGGSYAFSVIGYSGATAGIGDTEDARLNSSLKYTGHYGPARFGVQYQFAGRQYDIGDTSAEGGSAAEFDVGADIGAFSGDVVYSQKKDALSVGTLPYASSMLAGTESDNSSWAAMGKYTIGAAKVFGGYERIRFANPADPLGKGATDIGGYQLATMTTSAYNINKILQVYWAGLKYSVTPKLDLTGAYYGYAQNSYSSNGCSNTSASSCSGNLNAVSFMADYSLTKHFDVYGGAMLSQVQNGLSNGYLHDHSIDPMIGARVQF